MKKKLLTVVQILVTIGILAWVFHEPEKRADMAAAIQQASIWWLLAGVGAYAAVELLALLRWQLLMRVQGIFIGWGRMAALLMIGIFFNLFMPGGTGGDVIKVFYLLKETSKKAQALLAVLVDRIIGLLALMLLALFIVWRKYDWLQQTEITKNLTYTLLLILAVSFSGIAFAFLISGLGLAKRLPEKMPFRDKLLDISVAYNLYAKTWKISLLSIAISFGVHLGSFYTFYYAARSIGTKVPIGDFFAVMPIINVIAALPISVGGTGVREGLFQTLLGKLCGVPESQAVVLSLLGFLLIVFWGAVGGVIYLFYRPSEHERISTIQSEIDQLAHKIAEE